MEGVCIKDTLIITNLLESLIYQLSKNHGGRKEKNVINIRKR
jgi:hypothetical protein